MTKVKEENYEREAVNERFTRPERARRLLTLGQVAQSAWPTPCRGYAWHGWGGRDAARRLRQQQQYEHHFLVVIDDDVRVNDWFVNGHDGIERVNVRVASRDHGGNVRGNLRGDKRLDRQ